MAELIFAYGDLMNQYGEYAAIEFIKKRMHGCGDTITVNHISVGDIPDFETIKLFYMPAGTERSLVAAIEDMKRYQDALFAYLEQGGFALFTGNAGAALCKKITLKDGTAIEGLGYFDCEVSELKMRRYSEFIMQSAFFDQEIVGSINTSLNFKTAENPLFTVTFDSAKLLSSSTEGMVKNNAFATQLVGPMLVRNPIVLDFVCAKLCSNTLEPCSDDWYALAQKGYENVLGILKRECGKQV